MDYFIILLLSKFYFDKLLCFNNWYWLIEFKF